MIQGIRNLSNDLRFPSGIGQNSIHPIYIDGLFIFSLSTAIDRRKNLLLAGPPMTDTMLRER
jgi:hypothetical protein